MAGSKRTGDSRQQLLEQIVATLARELHFQAFRSKLEDVFKTTLTVKTRSFNTKLRIPGRSHCWPILAKVSKRPESGEHEIPFKHENTGVGGIRGGTVGFRECYASLVKSSFGIRCCLTRRGELD